MKKNLLIILIILVCFFILNLPLAQAGVFDEIYKNLGKFTAEAQLPGGEGISVFSIVIGIINVILTFVALLFIIMLLYSGFTYLTAAGNADKAKKALGIMKDSIIGIGIVFISAMFVNYILVKIFEIIQ